MDIQTRTETFFVVQLTESEARAALADPAALQTAIRRAITGANDHRAPAAIARRERRIADIQYEATEAGKGKRLPNPKAHSTKLTCTTCGLQFKYRRNFDKHTTKHGAAAPAAES